MSAVRGSALLKVFGGVAVVAAMASFLVVALTGARHRAHLTHCRNNLRRLGEDAAYLMEKEESMMRLRLQEWSREQGRTEPVALRGRHFWQAVRLVVYRQKFPDKRVGYKYVGVDMFDCPLNGLVAANWDSLDTIDYRGPAEELLPGHVEAGRVSNREIAADRDGNHGAGQGGYALFLSMEIRDRYPELVDLRIEEDAGAGTSD